MDYKIKKRNGKTVDFNADKIRNALNRANREVEAQERVPFTVIENIIGDITDRRIDTVEDIQDFIEYKLMMYEYAKLAKKYIIYRYTRSLVRASNDIDDSILSLVRNSNKEVSEENSNKNSTINSTQRDLIAGEVSKDITKRLLLPPHIVKAHETGAIHIHDMDYYIQPMLNCCLINIGDMLDNGTVMNGKRVDSPKSFQVACTVMTQIIAAVSSNQYGGCSVDISHLGKYLRKSREKYKKKFTEFFANREYDEEVINGLVEEQVKEELKSGVQTIQYQINTLSSSNGQSPFVTIFMHVKDDDPYKKEVAAIIEEILKQRIVGIKNTKGVYITPAFPKLIYVLDENNCFKGGEYDYLTKVAVECSAKRLYPDFISAKVMREHYEGNVFSPMGCRSFLSPYKDENGNYKFEGRANMGVVTLNLVQIALETKGDEEEYFNLLEDRLKLCYETLMLRYNKLKGVLSNVSPIHWQDGGLARLKVNEKIDKLLDNNYCTISLGYIGIYETTKLVTGVSHTDPEGKRFALKLMRRLAEACEEWKAETTIGFGLYGSPAESTCYRFAKIDQKRYGTVQDVTDKGYYTNSYHVDVREHISVFDKFAYESEFQAISLGGAISYAEIPNMTKNLEALGEIVKFIYDNIQYAEFNTKSDYCHKCGYDEEIKVNDNYQWICPQCGNTDKAQLTVIRRTCGYLGENFWNEGKTKEISKRVLHI